MLALEILEGYKDNPLLTGFPLGVKAFKRGGLIKTCQIVYNSPKFAFKSTSSNADFDSNISYKKICCEITHEITLKKVK